MRLVLQLGFLTLDFSEDEQINWCPVMSVADGRLDGDGDMSERSSVKKDSEQCMRRGRIPSLTMDKTITNSDNEYR